MKISGFTMVRNAEKYYFPIKESILSILPIVDEFIVALGNSDEGDHTFELIESINSPKIKIYHRIWEEKDFVNSYILAKETSFAHSKCTGDWCFYLQADEVVHEQDLPAIQRACESHFEDTSIEALLFKYYHFWGDYAHYLPYHGWYKNEMRIVRNDPSIFSYKDAQSFRKKPNDKLKVAEIDAHIYHYGWVRPPHLMQSKKKEHDSMHHGVDKTADVYAKRANVFDYGPLGRLPVFKGTHPKVLEEFRTKMNWQEFLNYSKKGNINRPLMKHERFWYRVLSFFENTLNGGKSFFGYSNWYK